MYLRLEGTDCPCREEERWGHGQLKCFNGLSKASEEKLSRVLEEVQVQTLIGQVCFCCSVKIFVMTP